MNLKETLLSPGWLIGISNACFVFAGFAAGRGRPYLALGIGLLGTALIAIIRKKLVQTAQEAYQAGYLHSKRRTTSR